MRALAAHLLLNLHFLIVGVSMKSKPVALSLYFGIPGAGKSTFAAYLAKKRAEGKHYNVALSHAAKKLVRLIFAMEKSQRPYCAAA